MAATGGVDWEHWAQRWERQQAGHMPRREERFTVLLALVAEACGPDAPMRIMDLASGPGAISRRALARFPNASVTAVDADPLLLAIGRDSLGDTGGRLEFVRADLRTPDWTAALPGGQFDAILSSTALHWLAVGDLVRLYRDLAGLVNPGGLFLNAEHLSAAPPHSELGRLAARVADQLDQDRPLPLAEAEPAESWEEWWAAAAAEPAFAALMAERERIFHDHPHEPPLSAALHAEALRLAGFAEAAVLWRWLDDAVVVARR